MKTIYSVLILFVACFYMSCGNTDSQAEDLSNEVEEVEEADIDENVVLEDSDTDKSATMEPEVVETETEEEVEKPKPVVKKSPKMVFNKKTYEFGTIEQGDVVNYSFTFVNKGNAPLTVNNATASCGCTRPEYPFVPIAPGESGNISVTFNSTGKIGNQRPMVTVSSNAGTHKLYFNGFVGEKKKEVEEEVEETTSDSEQ